MTRAAAAVIILLAAQQAAPPPPAAPPPRPLPLAANTLAAKPDAFYGQVVSISSEVAQPLSASVFLLSHDVLVIVPTIGGPVEAKSYLTVVGEAMRFEPAEIARRAKGYTLELSPELIAKYQGRPAILATSVVNAAFVDLGKRPPPPMTPEEDAFDKVMKRIGPVFGELRTAVAASNAAPIAAHAKDLKTAFADAEAFWKTRAAADALEWTRTARTQLTALERAGGAGNWDQVKTALAEVNRTCSACHTAYRERLEDGTYRVKAGPPAK